MIIFELENSLDQQEKSYTNILNEKDAELLKVHRYIENIYRMYMHICMYIAPPPPPTHTHTHTHTYTHTHKQTNTHTNAHIDNVHTYVYGQSATVYVEQYFSKY